MKIKLFVALGFMLFICGCSAGENTVKIIPRSEWGAVDPKPFTAHVPERITIHHEGEFFAADKDPSEFIKRTQVWGMGPERNWADIPYHFMIDGKGRVYEGRNVYTAGETNTTYNPTGHLLITLIGNFEEQPVTEKQLASLVELTAECCIKYNISPSTIKGHKDYAETLCPGKDLYKYIQDGSLTKMVSAEVEKRKKKQ